MRTCFIALFVLACMPPAPLPAQDDSSFFKIKIRAFQLEHADARDVVTILNDQFMIQFSANATTNAIYGRVRADVIEQVDEFVQRLEADAERNAISMARKQQTDTSLYDPMHNRNPLQTASLRLKHVDPVEVMMVLSDLRFYENDVAVSLSPQGDSLLARGSPDAISKLQVLIREIDVPSDKPKSDSNKTLKTLEQSTLNAKIKYHQLSEQLGKDHPRSKMLERQIEYMNELFDKQKQKLEDVRDMRIGGTGIKLQSAYELAERAAAKIADRWRREKASDSTSDAKLKELRGMVVLQVRKAFELRQQLKRQELEAASAQLEAIRMRLDLRQAIADKIVERRAEDLIRGVDLSWLSANAHDDNEADETAGASSAVDNQSLGESLAQIGKLAEGDVKIEMLGGLDTIVVRGKKQDVQRVVGAIETAQKLTEAEDSPERKSSRFGTVKTVEAGGNVELSLSGQTAPEVGSILNVERNGKPIGKLRVTSTQQDSARADVLLIEKGKSILSGDTLRAAE